MLVLELRTMLNAKARKVAFETVTKWPGRVISRLPPGAATAPHRHVKTEEIYYILEGRGLMQIDDETQVVGPGDAIAIPPGASHQITNNGGEMLKFLCCCAPCYEHEDTVLEE